MKTYRIFTILALASMLAGFSSCREKEVIADDVVIPGLGGTDEVMNELDEWLYENFTKTYNISVVYRWDASQMYSTITSTRLVPVEYDMVKPVMAAIRDVWFEPYVKTGGPAFLKRLAPKKIVLVGSPEYQNGAIKLGEAEGGNKILLLNINYFNPQNEEALRTQLHTIMHEFGHILHQNILYDKTFQNISAGFYEPDGWKEYTDEKAYQRGFTRNYGMNCVDDDFVEVLSMVLVYGRKWFVNTVLATAAESTVTDAVSALNMKLSMVEDYLLNSWNIMLFDDALGNKGLETYVQEAVENVINNPPIE